MGKVRIRSIVSALVLVAIQHSSVRAQAPVEPTPLAVRPQGSLAGMWRVGRAQLYDSFGGVSGHVEVENISAQVVDGAKFYGEYFDASGRLCFTLRFAQDQNSERRIGGFLPGETRTLWASSSYISPATQPGRLDLHLLGYKSGGKLTENTEVSSLVRSPVVLESSSLTDRDRRKIWLSDELKEAKGPFLDLVLAEITVDPQGKVQGTKILKTASRSTEAWFGNFVRSLEFRPAQIRGVDELASTLVLVRARVSLRCVHQLPFPPRESSFVTAYVQDVSAAELPSIIAVDLEPDSPENYWKHPSASYFEDLGVGSSWSALARTGEAGGEVGESSPQGPVLRRIYAPPGSDVCP